MKFETISQPNLPRFMILSICDNKLHISKAKAFGGFKEYFGSIALNRLTYVKSFNSDFMTTHEFILRLSNGGKTNFYINTNPGIKMKKHALQIVDAIKNHI